MTGIDQMVSGATEMQSASASMVAGTDAAGEAFQDTGLEATELASKIEIAEKAFNLLREVVSTGLELAELGAQAQRVEQRFEAFAEEAGGAEAILESFQDGAGGAASKMEAMTAASRLLQMGLVTNADEMRLTVELATRLGDQTASVSDRIGDFAALLANKSIPRLDNFGISSGAVRSRIEELQSQIAGLSREEAFRIAVFEQGQKSLMVLGERVDDDAMSFERAQARLADFRVELGQKLVPVVVTGVETFTDLLDIATPLLDVFGAIPPELVTLAGAFALTTKAASVLAQVGVKQLLTNITLLNPQLAILAGALGVVAGAALAYGKNLEKVNESQARAVETAGSWVSQAVELQGQGEDLASIMSNLAERTNVATDAWNSNIVTGTALGAVFGSHSKMLEVLGKTQDQVNTIAARGTADYGEYTAAIEAYNSTITDGAAKVTALSEAEYNRQQRVVQARADLEEMTAAYEAEQRAVENASTAEQDYQMRLAGTSGLAQDAAEANRERAAALERGAAIMTAGERAVEIATKAAADAQDQAEAEARELEQAQRAAAEAAQAHAVAQLDLAERLKDAGAAEVARQALAGLREQLEAGNLSLPEYEKAVIQVQDAYGLVTPESRALAEGLAELNERLAEGKIEPEAYAEALERMRTNAKDGEQSLDDLLDVFDQSPDAIEKSEAALGRLDDALSDQTGATNEAKDAVGDLSSEMDDVPSHTDTAGDAVLEFKDTVGDMPGEVRGASDEVITAFQDIKTEAETLPAAGAAAGAGLASEMQRGFDGRWGEFVNDAKRKFAEFGDMLPGSEPKDTTSPLYGLSDRGAAILMNLMDGVSMAAPDAESQFAQIGGMLGKALIGAAREHLEEGETLLESLFGIGGTLGGLGSTAARMLQEETVEPLESGMESIDAAIEEQERRYQEAVALQREITKELGGSDMLRSLLLYGPQTREQEILLQRWRATVDAVRSSTQNIANLDEERAELAEEYAEQQERILRLQEAQQNFRFLEQQFELLELIREHGLDAAEILGGMEFGVNASLEGVIDAMTAAMEAIIEQAEQELEISSPSKVFERIGGQAMEGMAMGIERLMNLPVQESLLATQRMISAPALATTSSGPQQYIDNSRNLTLQMGGNTITGTADEARLNSRISQTVRREMRGQ